jgi:hypothetical protein
MRKPSWTNKKTLLWRQLGSVAKFVSLSDNLPILVIEKSDD